MGLQYADRRRRYTIDRMEKLIELLKRRGYCSVKELSDELGVSPMTIRRDLGTLAAEHLVGVTHGGARLLRQQAEPDVDIRLGVHEHQKRAIGRLAATLIESGDVIGLDAGSTVIHVAHNLPELPLTVVTYSLAVANVVAKRSQRQLHLLGGTFHPESMSFSGPQARIALRDLRINKMFLAASGLLLTDGLSCTYLFDAEVKKALIESSLRLILCMDSSKIGKVFLAHFSDIERVHVLVTDSAITPSDRHELESRGVQVMIAPI